MDLDAHLPAILTGNTRAFGQWMAGAEGTMCDSLRSFASVLDVEKTFRTAAFPAWLGWLSVAAALAQVVPVLGIALDGGPLAADGWLSAYVPYPLYAVWLACTAVVTVSRLGSAAPLVDGTSPAY